MTQLLIAIDGPAGCGKSTVARELARALDGAAFSSGVVYRAVTLIALEDGVELDNPEAIVAALDQHRLSIDKKGYELCLTIDGRDRARELHGTRVSREIHWIADAPLLRARLLPLQRDLRSGASSGPLVIEGRDIGTIVFPDAGLKLFLTASVEERTRRRLVQLREDFNEDIESSEVRSDVEIRDKYDSERSAAPLKEAVDALVLDTTGKSVEEVVAEVLAEISRRGLETSPAGG